MIVIDGKLMTGSSVPRSVKYGLWNMKPILPQNLLLHMRPTDRDGVAAPHIQEPNPNQPSKLQFTHCCVRVCVGTTCNSHRSKFCITVPAHPTAASIDKVTAGPALSSCCYSS
jgi:hypothetical protein